MHSAKSTNKVQKIKRTDIFSKKKRSDIMSRVKNKGSKIEKTFEKILKQKGLIYKKNNSKLFGKPDFLLKNKKTVIFIDSCFWHGCRWHRNIPVTNKVFWTRKIFRNKERDKEVNKHYKKQDWNIIRIWEHNLKRENLTLKL